MEGNDGRPGDPGSPEQQTPATPEPTGMGVPTGVPGGYGETAVETVQEQKGLTGARLTALVTALVLVVAGAAIGVVLSGSDGGADLEDVVPADSIVFAKANLLPPGDQRENLRGIIERFPTPEGGSPGDAFRDFLDEGLSQDTSLSFSQDIAPWIGDQIGFVMTGFDVSTGEPRAALIASVRDEARARATLERLQQEQRDSDDEFVFDVKQGAVFVAPDLLSLERSLGAVNGSVEALSTNAEYAGRLESLGSDVLGLMWFDGRALASVIPRGALPSLPGGFGDLTGTSMVVLRAERDAAVIEGIGSAPASGGGSGVPAIVESSSADQIGSLTLFDPANVVTQMLAFADLAMGQVFSSTESLTIEPTAFSAQQGPSAAASAWLRENLGLDLERDILPWMHGELSVIVGNVALPAPDIGVVIESTDDDAARRTLDALGQRLGRLGREAGFEVTSAPGGFALSFDEGFTVVVRRIAGRVVIAGSDAYADVLLSSSASKLADDAVYQRAVGAAGQNVSFQVFVRLDRIVSLVNAFGGGDGAETQRYLEPLGSVGMRASVDAESSRFRMVVTFK